MKGCNRSRLRSALDIPNLRKPEKSILPQTSDIPINRLSKPNPRPHRCSDVTRNLSQKPEITEASDLKVKVSKCRRKGNEDLWEEGGRVCSLQEVAVKTPSGVVTVEHFGNAVTPNVDFVESAVRVYRRNVSKYTIKCPILRNKKALDKSPARIQILTHPPLMCDCVLTPQQPLPVGTLPKVIFKDSANFAKFRHDIDDEPRLSDISATKSPISAKVSTPLPRSSRSKMSNLHKKKLLSSNSLFSYAEPKTHSRLSRIAETASKYSSRASSTHPTIRDVSGKDGPPKKSESHVIKRIVYLPDDAIEEIASSRKSVAKCKIVCTRRKI